MQNHKAYILQMCVLDVGICLVLLLYTHKHEYIQGVPFTGLYSATAALRSICKRTTAVL